MVSLGTPPILILGVSIFHFFPKAVDLLLKSLTPVKSPVFDFSTSLANSRSN